MDKESLFARKSLRAYALYLALSESEKNPDFKKLLEELAITSKEQFDFWARKSGVRGDMVRVPHIEIIGLRILRFLFGLTLTTKFIIGRKEQRVISYQKYCRTSRDEENVQAIEIFIARLHAIIDRIQEKRAYFFSNVVLGVNDALIELTGALVGFTFTIVDLRLVSVVGLVTGLSASMSMAASAFLQARHQNAGKPLQAAFFTGGSYMVIVLCLIAPFLLFSTTFDALIGMGIIIFFLIALISFCSAVLLEKPYLQQFTEMVLFSLGVSVIAFAIGHWLNSSLHIQA